MDIIQLAEYDFLEGFPWLYTLSNLFFTLFSLIWLVALFFKKRAYFLKPSILLLTFTHIFFQWPMVIFSGYAYYFLHNPLDLSLLVNGYMIIGLFLSSFFWNEPIEEIYKKIEASKTVKNNDHIISLAVFLLFFLEVLFLLLYFYYVPFKKTGIYAVLFNPTESDIARNLSFHLLPQYMKYMVTLMQNSVIPLLLCLLFLYFFDLINKKLWLNALLIMVLGIFSLFVAGITGARYPIGKAILAVAFVSFYKNKLKIPLLLLLASIIIVLIPAAVITLWREGSVLTFSSLLWYLFFAIIWHRVFCVPFQVGLWHMQYSQLFGSFGIAAIAKLAFLFDKEPIAVPEIIGGYYLASSKIVTHSNVGYIFSYYSYFGLTILPLLIILLLLVDFTIPILRILNPVILLATLGALSVAVLEFVQSDYLTVLITHGYLIIPLLALMLQKITYFTSTKKEINIKD